MTEHTGYATVSGFHEFLYEPDKPLHGDLTDYAYHQRGALAYVVELWDLFKQLGIERKKPFVDHYSQVRRARTCARWRSSTASTTTAACSSAGARSTHPQLGEVEVGGFDPRVGIWNPPYEKLAETCAAQSAAFLRVAALVPRVALEVVRQERTARATRASSCASPTAATSAPTACRRRRSSRTAEPLRLTAERRGRDAASRRPNRSSRSATSTAGAAASTAARASSALDARQRARALRDAASPRARGTLTWRWAVAGSATLALAVPVG